MVYLNITGGIDAKPSTIPKSTDGPELLEKSRCRFTLSEIFDLSARGDLDVAFLSGVQIDQFGRLNSSVIGSFDRPKVRLPGGAGSAVLLPTAKKTIVWRTKHNTKSFVEKGDFITATGNIDMVVTPLCVFTHQDGNLVLDKIHPYSSLKEIEDNTGFSIIYDDIEFSEPPTAEEMEVLNRIDPEHIREIEMG